MMTLKHIGADGREYVVSLASVSFDPDVNVLVGHGVEDGMTGGKKDQEWSDGKAFLMNEQGKTVATYIFNKK